MVQISTIFFAGSETAQDVAQEYVQTPVGTFTNHKFVERYSQGEEFESLSETGNGNIHYIIECFVDYYIYLAITTSQEQLRHVANVFKKGIHDVFPSDIYYEEDSISPKKLKKQEAQ